MTAGCPAHRQPPEVRDADAHPAHDADHTHGGSGQGCPVAPQRRPMDERPDGPLSPSELAVAAREAWRRAPRCVGRAGWASLVLRDSRHLRDPDEVAADMAEHLRFATNGGAIRPTLTVLDPSVQVLSEQLVRYADDPQYAGFVESLRHTGWRPSGERFEILPLVVRSRRGVTLHDLPREAVLEVPISHPELPWFADLGLRWLAVPAIANMLLQVDEHTAYPCVFNGWYVSDEISTRNFGGPERYDVLPAVADRMGLPRDRDGYWRQRALVELEAAVLWSYRGAGVKISSPHHEARRFVNHVDREQAAGRTVPSDWSWVISPLAPVLLPTYHRYYDPPDPGAGPDLVQDETLTQLGRHGGWRATLDHVVSVP